MKIDFYFSVLIMSLIAIFMSFVSAADFTPQGNINLRDVYNITGAPFVNATLYYGNGSQLTGVTADASTINHSLLDGLQGGDGFEYFHINSSQYSELATNIFNWITSWLIPDQTSNYIYNDSTTIYFNETHLNATGDSRYINVDGDTVTGNLIFNNASLINLSSIQLNLLPNITCDTAEEGELFWDVDSDVPSWKFPGTTVCWQMSEENFLPRSTNRDSFAHVDCTVVRINDSTGNILDVKVADYTSNVGSRGAIAVATETINAGSRGRYTTSGLVGSCNLSAFSEGDALFLGENGTLIRAPIFAPNNSVFVGIVKRAHETEGQLFVKIIRTPNMEELSDTSGTLEQNSIYQWNATSLRFESTIDPTFDNLNITGNANFSGNLFGSNSKLTNDNNYWNDTYATFNETYADTLYLTGQLSLFFYNNSDTFNSSYSVMNTTINEDLQTDTFSGLSDGDNLLAKRILSTLDLSILEIGAYNQHTTIDYTSGSKDVQLRSTIHVLLANGTEIQVGSSPVSPVLSTGTYQQIIWTGVIDTEYTLSTGDYLTMYLYAVVSGGGGAPTIDLVVGGSTSARLDIGINPNDISTTEVDPFWTGNSSTVARIGDCPTGQFVQNTTTGGVECGAPTGSGTVTSVAAGNGMDFTNITSTGFVTMGLPGSLTAATVNALTATSHTHAITGFLESLLGDTTPQLGGYLDANGQNIGSTTDEIENIYVGDTTRIYFGDGQDASMYFNGTNLIISG